MVENCDRKRESNSLRSVSYCIGRVFLFVFLCTETAEALSSLFFSLFWGSIGMLFRKEESPMNQVIFRPWRGSEKKHYYFKGKEYVGRWLGRCSILKKNIFPFLRSSGWATTWNRWLNFVIKQGNLRKLRLFPQSVSSCTWCRCSRMKINGPKNSVIQLEKFIVQMVCFYRGSTSILGQRRTQSNKLFCRKHNSLRLRKENKSLCPF